MKKLNIKKYASTKTSVLAKETGFSESFIRMQASKEGVKKKGHNGRWDKKDIDYVKRWKDKRTYQKIADKLKRTRWAIVDMVRQIKKGMH